jgi:hypothetical protein
MSPILWALLAFLIGATEASIVCYRIWHSE